MTEQERFTVVGIRQEERSQPQEKGWRNLPWVSLALLCVILLGCLGAGIISSKEPSYLDLANCAHPPDGAFFFGTDTLGRDIFSCIWHGGRVSLSVGLLSAMASTLIALAYGSAAWPLPGWTLCSCGQWSCFSAYLPCWWCCFSKLCWVGPMCSPSPW